MEKFNLNKFLGPYASYLEDPNAGRFQHIVNTLAGPISLLETFAPEDANRNKEYLRNYLDILDENQGIRKKQLTTPKDLKVDIKGYIERLKKSSMER